MPERVVLGRVVGAHGLRGEVRVRFFGDGPGNLLGIPAVWLADERDDPAARRHGVVSAGTGRSKEVRLALEDVGDREAAEALRGRLVLADAAELAPLEPGEFYWHELVGCSVVDREGRRIGTVREIWDAGAHDVLVVEDDRGERHLFSTARELMPEVDLERRRIVVLVLPGMQGPGPDEG